ncbi:YggT family protein [Scopulibacillus cellulosilyticus]|uniref:YggT family protein n=1 Tax=Scopulibacillus cellulosilyticus TaxID=2665665 RepID=A0ABW2Q181_9BACL
MKKNAKQSFLGRVINIVLSIVQIIIALYIVIKLFGASNVPFVQWLNRISQPLLHPFEGMFNPVTFSKGYTLDLSAVFALIVYSVIGYILIKLVSMLNR